jgi:lipoyl(octanoyl) transferase
MRQTASDSQRVGQETTIPPDLRPAEWATSPNPVPYTLATRLMDARAESIADGRTPELIWLLEHPPLYTGGTRAKPGDLLDPNRFPVHRTGRGGELTYHGPGQRVVYTLLHVRQRFGNDVRALVTALEQWIIEALQDLGAKGVTRPGKTGIWIPPVEPPRPQPAKIAAIGLRVRRGVSFHGFSLNVSPNLEHFSGIVPCGISGGAVTSLAELGLSASMKDVDNALREVFGRRFGTPEETRDPLREGAHPNTNEATHPAADLEP